MNYLKLPPIPALAVLVAAPLALRFLLRRGRPADPVDPYAPHEPATALDPAAKPGAKRFRAWVVKTWGERENPPSPQNISRADRTDRPSEHHEGRAWDLMTRNLAHGQAVVDALLAPDPETGEPHALARRAGVMYLIWNRRIWRAYPWAGKPAGSWSDYGGPNPHTDHVHFSLSRAGARAETSLYRTVA